MTGNSIALSTRSKRPKLEIPFDLYKKKSIQVSATQLFNYMIKDPLVDWLSLSKNNHTCNALSTTNKFTDFIMKRGIEFEDKLVKYINNNVLSVVSVSNYITNDSLNKTKELMRNGVPLIHSAPVRNSKNNTHGIIDLLVRSDYINKLVDVNPLSDSEIKSGNGNFYYIVIDIKFSTLPFRADGIHLLNSGNYPAYKSQCLIYTDAVGQIQGYTSPYAFIMGRRWKYTQLGISKHNYSCLNRLGRIDYSGIDNEYKTRTKSAIQWIRDVKTKGNMWNINPPSRYELYPNMCIDSGIWNAEKEKISDNIGEITSIWNVGLSHRNTAMEKHIVSWKDERCTSELLGIKGKRAVIIDAIMNINRQNEYLIYPSRIKSNMYNWKKESNELYVDFETISDIFADFDHLPKQNCCDMIFMIGIGRKVNGKFVYTNFICEELTYHEEYRIMEEFVNFIRKNGNPKLFYWVAESSIWNTAVQRQMNKFPEHDLGNKFSIDTWSDLSQLFQEEPIVIKNCFKFGLKAIASAMRKHGMISTLIESNCNNGMTAMVSAWKTYDNFSDPVNSDEMKDISKYNEFDCKVLWEILSYLRKNHV